MIMTYRIRYQHPAYRWTIRMRSIDSCKTHSTHLLLNLYHLLYLHLYLHLYLCLCLCLCLYLYLYLCLRLYRYQKQLHHYSFLFHQYHQQFNRWQQWTRQSTRWRKEKKRRKSLKLNIYLKEEGITTDQPNPPSRAMERVSRSILLPLLTVRVIVIGRIGSVV
jgi:hypothetical protein